MSTWGKVVFSPRSAAAALLSGGAVMDIVHTRCCGLDVHKKSVVACVLISQPDGLLERPGADQLQARVGMGSAVQAKPFEQAAGGLLGPEGGRIPQGPSRVRNAPFAR